ncbi:MAG: hypothetical protein HRU75_05010 [Planctomycetia bacterium]|nr:MAG: hypothetical protein HRU75_05010 [Planctomycetia bacterium]
MAAVLRTGPSAGVSMVLARDGLGRVTSMVRSAPGQATITTAFDYSSPLQETATTTAGSLSQVRSRKWDKAGRLVSVTDGTGDGATKTLFKYESQGAGLLEAVYNAYPASATQGTAGLRDRVTEHYRDGRVKRTHGGAVVESNYDYGTDSDNALRSWTKVTTGASSSSRHEKTWRDLAGRVRRIERPGWLSATSSTTLTTDYAYATNGQLTSVTSTGEAPILYDHDDLGHVERTVIDVDGDSTIDESGPDRITRSHTAYEAVGGEIWQISRSYVYAGDDDDETLLSESRTRLTGFSGSATSPFITAESVSIDIHGNATTTTVTLERDAAERIETTDYPAIDGGAIDDAQRSYIGDRLMTDRSANGLVATYGYDALGRTTTVTDARGNTTTTHYDTNGRVDWTEDEDENRTEFVYYDVNDHGTAGSFLGRVKLVNSPTDAESRFGYNDRGQTTRTWGDVPQPVEYGFNDFGEQVSMKTWQTQPDDNGDWTGAAWPSSPTGVMSETTWTFHEGTGLLNRKTYDDDTYVDYTYTANGRMRTRAWARQYSGGPLTTTYRYYGDSSGFTPPSGYSNHNTGELGMIDYGDGTPDVSYGYSRSGLLTTVVDATGTRTLAYDAALQPTTETLPAFFGSRVLTRAYTTGTPGPTVLIGRPTGFSVAVGSTTEYETGWHYHSTTGRLERITGPGLPTAEPGLPTAGTEPGVKYSFLTDSEFVEKIEVRYDGDVILRTTRQYEATRDLIDHIENQWVDDSTLTTISKYDYTNDDLARRTGVARTGAAFSASQTDAWGYNDRNELTGQERSTGTDAEKSAAKRKYQYDAIGNRVYVEPDTTPLGTSEFEWIQRTLIRRMKWSCGTPIRRTP